MPRTFRHPSAHVYSDELKPRARNRLVILVLDAVPPGNVLDGRGHDAGRLGHRIKAQVCPSELEVLTVAEAAAGLNDLLKDLEVTFPHGPDGSCGPQSAQGSRGPAAIYPGSPLLQAPDQQPHRRKWIASGAGCSSNSAASSG
jgi:hypothetical protein